MSDGATSGGDWGRGDRMLDLSHEDAELVARHYARLAESPARTLIAAPRLTLRTALQACLTAAAAAIGLRSSAES